MIPYFEIPAIPIAGPLKLEPFGILLAIGVLFGSWRCRLYTERHRMDEELLRWLGIRLIVWGFVMSHVTNTLFYEPHRLADDPLLLVKVWDGISSYGGILGGVFALGFYARRIKGLNTLRWVDMAIYGVVPAYMFGRVGCAIVHDHIGQETDFPLAIDFPARFGELAGTRHDLGLYEVPVLFLIWVFVLLLARIKQRPDGLLTAFVAVTYPIPRFFFEFLRTEVTDRTYFGLTPAQYFSIVTLAVGLAIFYRLYVKKQATQVSDPEELEWEPPGGRPAPAERPASRAKKQPGGGPGARKRKKKK